MSLTCGNPSSLPLTVSLSLETNFRHQVIRTFNFNSLGNVIFPLSALNFVYVIILKMTFVDSIPSHTIHLLFLDNGLPKIKYFPTTFRWKFLTWHLESSGCYLRLIYHSFMHFTWKTLSAPQPQPQPSLYSLPSNLYSRPSLDHLVNSASSHKVFAQLLLELCPKWQRKVHLKCIFTLNEVKLR